MKITQPFSLKINLCASVTILLCFFSVSALSQKSIIDSLAAVEQKTPDDTGKFDVMYAIGRQLGITGQYEKALLQIERLQSLIKIISSKPYSKNKLVQQRLLSENARVQNFKGVIYHRQSKYKEALDCYFKALKAREELNDRQGMAMACNNISGTYGILGDEVNELKYLELATTNFNLVNDKKGLGQAYYNQSLYYYRHGELDKAIETNLKAQKMSEEAGDIISITHCLLHTGVIYKELGNHEESNNYYRKALTLAEQTGDKVAKGYIYSNIAINYKYKGDYENSFKFQRLALQTQVELDDKKNIANVYLNTGQLFAEIMEQKFSVRDSSLAKQMQDSAIECYSRSKEIFEALGEKTDYAKVLCELGRIFTIKKDFEKAESFLNKGLNFTTQSGDRKEKMYAYLCLSDLFSLKQEPAEALKYHRLYSSLRDSIFNETTAKTITELNTKYETGKKEKQIVLLEKQQEINRIELILKQEQINKQALADKDKTQTIMLVSKDNEIKGLQVIKQSVELEKQKEETEKKKSEVVLLYKETELQQARLQKVKLTQSFTFLGIIALLLFGGFTYYRFRQRKQLSEKLSLSLAELKQTQKQLLDAELERAQENVRLRISRDIHDEIGSNLTKISLLSELVSSNGENHDAESNKSLNEISHYATSVNNSLSEIIWAVNPKQDTLDSLLAYMRNHSHSFLQDTGISLKIIFPESVASFHLNPDLKRNIFLVLKEALNNSVKYSKAKNIEIKFSLKDKQFSFYVKDDGRGFDVSHNHSSGNGLSNMADRMEQSKGKLKIISSPGMGCTVEVHGVLF